MTHVLDAGPMLAFLKDETGASEVEQILLDPDSVCYAHAVNICEVFYDLRREAGEEEAQTHLTRLFDAGVQPREDMDRAFWEAVGRLKADPPRKSLADCFCIALAQRLEARLITTDHHEFDALVPLGLCPIRFIR